MLCFGFYAQVRLGETSLRTMETGKTLIADFAAVATKGIGRCYSRHLNEPDFEWLMIDASHIKLHPHAAGARGGNQDMARTKGSSTPRYTWAWMRGMPVRILVTAAGTVADCAQVY